MNSPRQLTKEEENKRQKDKDILAETGLDTEFLSKVLGIQNSWLRQQAVNRINEIGVDQFVMERLNEIKKSTVRFIQNRRALQVFNCLIEYHIKTYEEKGI